MLNVSESMNVFYSTIYFNFGLMWWLNSVFDLLLASLMYWLWNTVKDKTKKLKYKLR